MTELMQYDITHNKRSCIVLITPLAKMFLRSFIEFKKIRFEEVMKLNDQYFVVSAGIKASNIKLIPSVVYVYTINDGSISRSYDKQKDFDQLYQTMKVNRLLLQNGYTMFIRIYWRLLLSIFKRHGFYLFTGNDNII